MVFDKHLGQLEEEEDVLDGVKYSKFELMKKHKVNRGSVNESDLI